MKKVLSIAALSLCFFQLWGEPAYAGSLNANESELIGIISGTYEYDGVTYKVKDLYIDMAIDYLMQDNIDLTDEQKQAAIQKMYSSVAQGISEGYLEVVKDAQDGGKQPGEAGGQGVSGATGAAEGNVGNGENGAAPVGSEAIDGSGNGGKDVKPKTGTTGLEETNTEKPGIGSEKVREEEVKSPIILALESITQEEMQQKLQQQNGNEELQAVQATPVEGYPVYSWKMACGVCAGIFIGTVGGIGAELKVKRSTKRAEKRRRVS